MSRIPSNRSTPFSSTSSVKSRYAVTMCVVFAAIALRTFASPSMGQQSSIIFLAAILICAWTGGLGPALLSLFIFHIVHGFWFIEPPRLWEPTLPWLVSTGAYYLVGIIVGVLSERRMDALQRATSRQREALSQREQLHATLACLADGVLVTDMDGNIILMNRVAERMTGYEAPDALGKPWRSVFTIRREDGAANVESPVGRALDECRVVHERTPLTLFSRLGTTTPISYSASPISEVGNEVTGVVLIFRDESERRRVELALREADRRKDDFLAMLAHELRNPLAPIVTGLELLKLTNGDAAASEEVRETMQRQTQHMVRLIKDLMNVSRISRGKIELRRSPVELERIVRDAIESTRDQYEKLEHQLIVRLPEVPVVIYADASRIAQVLTNLLDNAAKFTPAPGRIELTAKSSGDNVIISLSDTGIGIPPERTDEVFQMFAQVSGRSGYSASGLGIGLALVKRLVEMHSGTIEVRSEGANLGSTFDLHLPMVTNSDAPPGSSTRSPPPHLSAQRVLVVDDNADALATLSQMMTLMGNEVRQAHDGREALDVAQAFRPTVVLMDLGMPHLDGYEAARRMRREAWGRDLMLVATSGWGQHEDVKRSIAAGFNLHLVKPITINSLRDALGDAPHI